MKFILWIYDCSYLANFYNVLSVDEEPYQEMKRFMEDTLTAARTNNEKVHQLLQT